MRILLGGLVLLAACEAATSSDSDAGPGPGPDASADATTDTGSPIVDSGLPDVWANPLTTECDAQSAVCGDYFTLAGKSVITFCWQGHCAFECSVDPGSALCAYLDASCLPQPPTAFGICATTPASPSDQ
jgi:hypothetical protein